jgi:gliding motility-associated-like protein
MKKGIFTAIFLVGWLPVSTWATINPSATYTNSNGEEITVYADDESGTGGSAAGSLEGDAPLFVRFTANASDLEAGSTLEWRFRHSGAGGSNSEITRYEENPEFTFTESGLTVATLYVRLNNDLVDSASINVTISESHLEMPNAFSPNDDGHNDFYGAKGACHPEASGKYKSIVEFHGYIFNRWGQKLFEWTDISKGWDGKYNGTPCKDGVYFVLVKARGADGKEYDIRRDVNLIRNFNEVTSTATSTP